MVLTEEQFKKLLSHEIRNVAFIPLRKGTTNIFRQELNEGLYKTFDIDFVVRHFCSYLNFTYNYHEFVNDPDRYNGFITKVSGDNDEEYIEFVSIDDEDFLRKADDALKLCGYYMAFSEEYCKGYVQSGYEKRHDKRIRLDINKLYHVTRRESLPKIRREGLVPKSRDKQTHHLDRIYFFKKDYGEDAFKKIAEDLYGGNTSFGYAVIEVDLDKIGRDIIFHNDLNTKDGIYTTDNIPPDALKVIYQYRN